jgi:hypothetical protein
MFNSTSIPRALVAQVMEGLANREKAQAAADLICPRVTVPQMKGLVTVEPSLLSVPLPEGGGVAEGAVVKRLSGALGQLLYNLKVYKQTADLGIGDIVSADAAGYSLLQTRLAICQEVANMKLDLDFQAILASTTLNLEYNVPTDSGSVEEWDQSTSTPFEDLREALRLVPGSDTIVMGIEVHDLLASHPDFTAESSNYSGGTLDENEVQAILKKKLRGIRDVFVIDKFYNNAKEGQPLAVEYIFPRGLWLGHRSDLPLLSLNTENPRAINELDGERETRLVGYSRRSEIQRPHVEMGITFTDIFTP